MLKKNTAVVILCLTCLFLVPTSQAHAYLDPGSGSLIIQVLIAGLLSLFIVARVFKDTILSFLGLKPASKDEKNEYDDESTEQ